MYATHALFSRHPCTSRALVFSSEPPRLAPCPSPLPVRSLSDRWKSRRQVSNHARKMADVCPMNAAGVLKAIAQVAFYVSEPLVYLKTGVRGG